MGLMFAPPVLKRPHFWSDAPLHIFIYVVTLTSTNPLASLKPSSAEGIKGASTVCGGKFESRTSKIPLEIASEPGNILGDLR